MTNLDLVKFKEAAEKATPELVAALHSQRQLDFGGCEVGVSRQACDEAAEFIALARTAVPALIARLEASEARNATAYAEGVEAAAKAVEAYKRDASFDDSQVGALEHNSNEENIVCAIRSLLKDKPNEKTRQIAPPGQSTGE